MRYQYTIILCIDTNYDTPKSVYYQFYLFYIQVALNFYLDLLCDIEYYITTTFLSFKIF
jgi:hypothetical protein